MVHLLSGFRIRLFKWGKLLLLGLLNILTKNEHPYDKKEQKNQTHNGRQRFNEMDHVLEQAQARSCIRLFSIAAARTTTTTIIGSRFLFLFSSMS